MKKRDYASAGVDLDRYGEVFKSIKRKLRSASEKSGAGHFAGMIDLPAVDGGGLLVASVDGVGTKTKVALACGKHRGIGRDIVAHCINDVLCAGGRPVAFLDYVAFDRLDPGIFGQVVSGITAECRKHRVQLIGGETAEMPGVYRKGEYDLVGFIIGLAESGKVVDGSRISRGDVLVGLPSNGLHTNGYSLARHVLLDKCGMKVTDRPRGWRQDLGTALLKPHRSYFESVYPLVKQGVVTGIAHITGGGIAGNLSRILPPGTGARLKRSTWKVPRVFELIAEAGGVEEEEMYRVFNMGLGMILAVPHDGIPAVLDRTPRSRIVGEIVSGEGEVEIE
jgi:phosphoribosylformylglycinamidine cyclo-ligase